MLLKWSTWTEYTKVPSSLHLVKLRESEDLSPRGPSTEDLKHELPRARKVTGETNWTNLLRLAETLRASSSSCAADTGTQLKGSSTTEASTIKTTHEPNQKRFRSECARSFDPVDHCPARIVKLRNRTRLPPKSNRHVEPEVISQKSPAARTEARTGKANTHSSPLWHCSVWKRWLLLHLYVC